MEISKTLKQTERALLFVTFFLFPLLLVPSFTNIFAVPKLMLLASVASILLLIKAVRVVIERKIEVKSSKFDSALFLLALSYLLSVIIISPNKVEALLDPNRGALLVVLMVVLAVTLPKDKKLMGVASLSALGVMLLGTVASYFSLLGFLPKTLAFINTKGFNFLGNLLNQIMFAGFYLAMAFEQLRESDVKGSTPVAQKENQGGFLNLLFLASLLTVVVSSFVLLKDLKPQFFPLAESWEISVDVLKNPKNAIFGVGPANYLSLYTRTKPMTINANATLWNANIEYSRSAALHFFSEVGLLGLVALGLILFNLWHTGRKQKLTLAMIVFGIWTLLFPLSQTYLFMLLTLVYLLREDKEVRKFDLKDLDLFAYATALVLVVIVAAFGYFYGRAIFSDYLVAKSFVAASENKAQDVYDSQLRAIQMNPFSQTARSAFIQTNMVLANSLAQKQKPTDEDKQQYSQLIQQAITNARDTVTLNPAQATNWAALGSVYQTLLGQAEGASEWTIASYQRAIAIDPRNPGYYFSLGSVYYALGNFEEASGFFTQAIALKNDIPNYYYNLAWSEYQKKNFAKAVNAMETAMQFTQKGTNDYKKVKAELAEFKKKLPAETETQNTQVQPETLSQPTTVPTGQPTIELPENSAPPTVTEAPQP